MTADVDPQVPQIKVRGLQKMFPVRGGLFGRSRQVVHALDNVNLDIFAGETLGLVGESGSGKTTVGRLILGLIAPTSGSISFNGEELVGISRERMRALRREMQIIFQDPFGSLNPRMTVEQIIGEPLVIHRLVPAAQRRARIAELLDLVGLQAQHAKRFPHEFSGGQRQRIGIARALAVNPRFIVADEPVSALDVSIQAQVINLLEELQARLGLTYLFIAHDLAVVRHIAKRVAVMYLGQICETAPRDSLYLAPKHPYTQVLLSAVPVADPRTTRSRIYVSGEIPSALEPPSGCRFYTRCPLVFERCKQEIPKLISYDDHAVACHWVEEHKGEQPGLLRSSGTP